MAECSGCGRQIAFAVNSNNRKVPMEKVQAFELEWGGELHAYKSIRVERDIYISHFQTCPQAKNFSNKPPKQQASFEGFK